MLKEGTFVRKKYINLLICAILGWIVAILGGMVDSVIAGLFLDSNAVSAVGLITPLGSIILSLGQFISIGCSLMYSINLGASDVEGSKKIAGMGLLVSIILGILMSISLIVFKNPILKFYGCSGELYEYASQYYNPLVFMALIQPTMWTVYNLVTYDGDAKLILIIDILMAASNAALSLLFVQTKGIVGLAIGTTLSYLIGLLLTIPHFFSKSNSIHFKLYFSIKDLFQSIKLSSSTALTYLYVAIVDIAFNKFIIVRFGQDLLPAYTVVNVVLNFASFLVCTMTAGGVFVTIAYGEDNNPAIRRVMKLVHRSIIISSLIFSTLMIFIAQYWPIIYDISDPLVAEASIFAGRVIPITFIFAAFVYNYISFYSSIDKSIESNILSITYTLIGPLVISFPLGTIFGFNAMSIGFVFTPIFSVIVLFIYCLIKGEAKRLPYLLNDDDKINAHYDIKLEKESIVELRDNIHDWLLQQDVKKRTINEIELIIEETLLHIKNRNKKTIYCECDLLLNKDYIWLITKDNGMIFNMIKDADDSLDLSCYVAARVMEQASSKSYTTTTSFNRNTYVWKRES